VKTLYGDGGRGDDDQNETGDSGMG